MNTKCMFPCVLAAAFILSGLWAPVQAGKPAGKDDDGPSYAIHGLDDFGGTVTNVIPRHINSAGQVVGQVQDPHEGTVAAFWSVNTNNGSSQLSILTDGKFATAINVHGEIVGGQVEADENSIGRYWSSRNDNQPLRLLPLPSDEQSDASSINQDGIIVGWSEHRIKGFDPRPEMDPTKTITLKVERRPVVWRIVDGAVQGPFELPILTDIDPQADPNNAYGVAVSLNDNDQDGFASVVGSFMLSEEITTANPNAPQKAITDAARWTIAFDETGQLIATASVLSTGVASGSHVNNNDVACGEANGDAVIWSPNQQTLPVHRDVAWSGANRLNTGGLIVGYAWFESRRESGVRAVMWTSATSELTRLDSFVGKRSTLGIIENAMAVNDNNVIVGFAQNGGFVALPE